MPKEKVEPPKKIRAGTPEWLAYLRSLPKGVPVDEIEGPVVPFGAVPKKP